MCVRREECVFVRDPPYPLVLLSAGEGCSHCSCEHSPLLSQFTPLCRTGERLHHATLGRHMYALLGQKPTYRNQPTWQGEKVVCLACRSDLASHTWHENQNQLQPMSGSPVFFCSWLFLFSADSGLLSASSCRSPRSLFRTPCFTSAREHLFIASSSCVSIRKPPSRLPHSGSSLRSMCIDTPRTPSSPLVCSGFS
jgi:hypothetical protein